MAYQSEFHQKQVEYIMKIYEEWKAKNSDIPDTRFVKVVLRDRGHFMSYQGFMNGYKSRWINGKYVARKPKGKAKKALVH